MGEFVLEEGSDFRLIPDGTILTAEIIRCEDRETPFKDEKKSEETGKDVMQREVSFTFQVTEPGEFYARTVFGRTPTTFNTSEQCKLRLWVQELLAIDLLPEKFRFSTDTLEGLPCRIAVGVRTSKPNEKYPKGRQTNFAWDVLRTNSVLMAEDIF